MHYDDARLGDTSQPNRCFHARIQYTTNGDG